MEPTDRLKERGLHICIYIYMIYIYMLFFRFSVPNLGR